MQVKRGWLVVVAVAGAWALGMAGPSLGAKGAISAVVGAVIGGVAAVAALADDKARKGKEAKA